MAKVTGPLFSLSASGKIGNAMVHFGWKGRNVVRQWLKPTNPRDQQQKEVRQALAAAGKNVKYCLTPRSGLPSGSKLYQLLVDAADASQTWNATFAKNILQDLSSPAALNFFSDAMFGTNTIDKWREQAASVGFTTLTNADTYATAISPELQLAMGAYAAYKLALSSYTSIYNTHPSNWTTDEIESFACDYVTVM
jgi:hypothetical protein